MEEKLLFYYLLLTSIITGDFNFHNIIWGSQYTDSQAHINEHFIKRQQLTLLNTGQPTHFSSFNGTFSSIDLTIATPTITHLIDGA